MTLGPYGKWLHFEDLYKSQWDRMLAVPAAITMGAPVTMRFVILAAVMTLLAGFTQAELEKAKNSKKFFKDGYWKCLATEIVRVAPTNMPVQEFSVFVKRACSKERNDFFASLSNYVAMPAMG